MISNPYDTDGHDFLVFDHPDTGFMLNRSQFVSGIFVFGERRFETAFEYIASRVDFQQSCVAVFDLDAFLSDIFQRERQPVLNVALVCDLSTFSVPNRFLYEKFVRRNDDNISPAFLAVRIGGHARMARCRFSEIRMLPPCLKKKLNEMGILGCGFSGRRTVRFFLDVERILANLLTQNRNPKS